MEMSGKTAVDYGRGASAVMIKNVSLPFIGQLFDGYSLLLTEVK